MGPFSLYCWDTEKQSSWTDLFSWNFSLLSLETSQSWEAPQACSLHLLLWLFRRRCTLELLNIMVERKMAAFKSYEWWDVTLMTKFSFYSNQENKVIERRHLSWDILWHVGHACTICPYPQHLIEGFFLSFLH